MCIKLIPRKLVGTECQHHNLFGFNVLHLQMCLLSIESRFKSKPHKFNQDKSNSSVFVQLKCFLKHSGLQTPIQTRTWSFPLEKWPRNVSAVLCCLCRCSCAMNPDLSTEIRHSTSCRLTHTHIYKYIYTALLFNRPTMISRPTVALQSCTLSEC